MEFLYHGDDLWGSYPLYSWVEYSRLGDPSLTGSSREDESSRRRMLKQAGVDELVKAEDDELIEIIMAFLGMMN